MSNIKSALKAAKAALDAKRYEEVIVQVNIVLGADPQNYFAHLFLGLAQEKLERPDEAVRNYEAATKIKPNDDNAWQGLRNVYESQGSKKVDECISVASKLAEIYAEADDKLKCQTTVHRLLAFVKSNGTKAQYRKALEIQLPTSPIYDFLEGLVPHPSQTYIRVAEILEAEEKERINKEIGERRTRLGARIGQVTAEVQREVFGSSPLESVYQNIINWITDDEVRRQYEEKLLQRAYDTLIVLNTSGKAEKQIQVQELARGMVVVKHPFALAWDIAIEWKDAEDLSQWDPSIIWEYTQNFPERGLAKVLAAYIKSEIWPFEVVPGQDENEEESIEQPPEETLIEMAVGFEDAKKSAFAHRLLASYYVHLEEYESAVDIAKKGLTILKSEMQKAGLTFVNNIDATNLILATSLIHHQAPRHLPEAKEIFNAILKRKPLCTVALIGVGFILEDEENYLEAIHFLSKALSRDPENLRIGAEMAWCKALNGDYRAALVELERLAPLITTETRQSRELRALTLYRVGICHWNLDTSKAARKSRSGPYAHFLAAIKTNPSLAPAYTSLGVFYADYVKDKNRARQCFQKAFELSPAEVVAAERLARLFANQGEWEIVEVIAQRVVDSGNVRPPPGSKKKGIPWPFSALGVVQMNKQEYSNSIISFLSALRISPNDYHSYVGLGESYHNSGRYNSAAKAFQGAELIANKADAVNFQDRWFTLYMLSNVQRELGEYEEAINGYEEVLAERGQEYGVSIALLQTHIHQGWRNLETGFFGRAVDNARQAVTVAASIVTYRPHAFNLWRSLGDACSIFSFVQSGLEKLPFDAIVEILETGLDVQELQLLSEIDGVGPHSLSKIRQPDQKESKGSQNSLVRCLTAAIVAHKRAIITSVDDVYARAVSWYNLGWVEWRAHLCLGRSHESSSDEEVPEASSPFANAAIRCFKRAIELEASNSEFWNALGIVTAHISPKVAQHAFIRSLHLNERSAHTWANLGTLYFLEGDHELAHASFSRAQSTDPEYAHAWIGEGLIALLWGDKREALLHFAHAFEISDSMSLIAKRQYVLSTFDSIVSAKDATNPIQPIFALQQLHRQVLTDWPYDQLKGLYLERAADYQTATGVLLDICAAAEASYENSESTEMLFKFIQAKSDLARNRLAIGEFEGAAEDSQTILDLTSDGLIEGIPAATLDTVRVSARLTAGLAHYYLQDMDSSIDMFRSALQETNSDPDVVSLLAEVLWAKGGEEEKNVAKEQLFACIESHPHHVGAVVLLGAMAVVENDLETMEAVRSELMNMRTNEGLDTKTQQRIEKVLDAIAALSYTDDEMPGNNGFREVLNEVATSILLAPNRPHGWSQLATISEEPFAAQMALLTALRAIPPHGPLDSEDLASAFACAGTIADTQRAIMLSPNSQVYWNGLNEMLS